MTAGSAWRAAVLRPSAQMRGHGSVVVDASAEEALFACTLLKENAQIQLQAEIMGGAIALSEDEARDCAEGTFNPRLFPLLWAFTSGR